MRILPTLLLVIAFCGSAQAQEGRPPPGAIPAAQPPTGPSPELEAFMGELARFAAPYHEIELELVSVVGAVIADAKRAGEFFESRDETRGRARAEPWSRLQKKRLAEVRARAASLPRLDEAKLGPLARDVEAIQPMLETYRRLPVATRSMVDEAATAAEALIDDASASAAGDEDAAGRLAARIVFLRTVILDAENRQMEIGKAGLPAEHPQRPLITAIIAGNRALIEILKLQAATLAEQNADAQLTALIVRRQAQAILASADQVETLTNAAGSAFSEVAAQGPERVARKVAKAIETYRSSAVVEREVAGTFNAAANDLAAREIDWDRVNQRLEVLRPLVERRAALHKQRLEALTP